MFKFNEAMVVTASQQPDSRPQTETRRKTAAMAGAATAALLCFVMIMIPATLGAITSPFLTGWLPVILLFSLPWIAISGVIGAVSGWLVGTAQQSSLGAAIGAVLSLSIAGVYVCLFVSTVEPPENVVVPFVFAIVIGSTSGTIAVIAARSATSTLKKVRLTVQDVTILAIPLLIVTAWYSHQIYESHLRSLIAQSGGMVRWNALENPKGNWQIDFRGKQLNDSMLQTLLPTLSRFQRLDLDLGHTQVTDSGVATLTALQNMVRVRLDHTAVSNSQCSELARSMPQVEIRQEWP